MSKYIAIPWVLTTSCNPSSTTVSMHNKWSSYSRALGGDVYSRVSDSEVEAASAMIDDVLTFIKSFPDVKDGLMPISNFRLRYSVCTIRDDGRVWVDNTFSKTYVFPNA